MSCRAEPFICNEDFLGPAAELSLSLYYRVSRFGIRTVPAATMPPNTVACCQPTRKKNLRQLKDFLYQSLDRCHQQKTPNRSCMNSFNPFITSLPLADVHAVRHSILRVRKEEFLCLPISLQSCCRMSLPVLGVVGLLHTTLGCDSMAPDPNNRVLEVTECPAPCFKCAEDATPDADELGYILARQLGHAFQRSDLLGRPIQLL